MRRILRCFYLPLDLFTQARPGTIECRDCLDGSNRGLPDCVRNDSEDNQYRDLYSATSVSTTTETKHDESSDDNEQDDVGFEFRFIGSNERVATDIAHTDQRN